MFKVRTLLVWIVLLFETVISEKREQNGNFSENEYSDSVRVLSRRKRFLIFPDGSSLQLAFCVQTAALIPIGDIFLYANTAALAWNLPTDPTYLDFLRDKQTAQRRTDTPVRNKITYVDEYGKVISSVPYKRRSFIKPVFAKRSTDEKKMSFKDKLKIKIDRMKMHEKQSERNYLKKDHLDDHSVEFHRNSRLELYGKLETLLTTLGRDGRQCVLYKLCESAQRSEQGSFLQEFLRAVFTLPQGNEFEDSYHKEYDKAHTTNEDCSSKYPGCEESR